MCELCVWMPACVCVGGGRCLGALMWVLQLECVDVLVSVGIGRGYLGCVGMRVWVCACTRVYFISRRLS